MRENAGAITIQHGFHKQTAIQSRFADMTFTIWKKTFYPRSMAVT